MNESTFTHRQPRTWLKVSFTVSSALTESASAFLADLSNSGVEIIPETAQHPDLSFEKIVGYLTEDGNTQKKLKRLNSFLTNIQQEMPEGTSTVLYSEIIKEEDWGKTWKKHFKPARITKRLVVKPSWEEYTAEPNDVVLELDPGMAFGTGLHASTRLALELIDHIYQTLMPPPRTVLDVGTGTGILAMAAALFGAKEVIAIDNDPDAVDAAQRNIARNKLNALVTASDSDLSSISNSFDLVIANITHDTIIELAPNLKQALKADGSLILSGILQGEQEESICLAMSAIDLTIITSKYQEEWFAGRFTHTK